MHRKDPSYHAASMRLLDCELSVALAAQADIAEAERRLGVPLPRSVREWYSYENGIAILADHSNDDPPIEVRDFALLEWQSHRLLPIRNENQGVCVWAVEIDGSDDPGVWIDVDSHGKQWRRVTTSFSVYVRTCIWDYRRVLKRAAIVRALNRTVSGAALDFLSRHFVEEARTYGWPGSVQYRFGSEGAGVLIWASENQADWFIAAETEASLAEAVSALWHLDGVGEELQEGSNLGKRVLEGIRGRA